MQLFFFTFVTTLEMFESCVDNCFATFCMNDGISILIPVFQNFSDISESPVNHNYVILF